jgi:hypothetical protein
MAEDFEEQGECDRNAIFFISADNIGKIRLSELPDANVKLIF